MRKVTKMSNNDLMFVQNTVLPAHFLPVMNAVHMQKQNCWLDSPKSRKVKAISEKQMQCFSVDTQIKKCLHTKRA